MKILAISPHPDDVEFSISGILCKLMIQHEIMILYNTKYDLYDDIIAKTHKERVNDIVAACKLLNAKYDFFSLQDPILKLAEQLIKINPEIIFLPYPDDSNRIHIQVYQLYLNVIEAAFKMKSGEQDFKFAQLCYYETYSSINYNPDFVVDVTKVYSKARNILMSHKLGVKILPAIVYKFQIKHQMNGFNCSCLYGESLIFDKNSPYCWNENRKIGILILKELFEI